MGRPETTEYRNKEEQGMLGLVKPSCRRTTSQQSELEVCGFVSQLLDVTVVWAGAEKKKQGKKL